jgi:NDP-sugar pyrophosphorylase family protein
VVLSSDALTDINLTKMIEYHKAKKALATLALSQVRDVKEFGIVVLDNNGRIIGFQEKPAPSVAMSDLANAGIYIFDPEILKLIPEGPYDFGKQLFPHLAKAGAPIFGYKMIEYWSDVGGLEKYIQSNYDAIKGAVKIRIPGIKTASATWVGERESIDNKARFEGSVIIGDRCKIGGGVRIKDSIIGDKCQVESGAVIEGSVIWSDTYIGTDAHLANSVIGNFCYVGDKSKIMNSIIANRCLIPFATLLPPGSKIDPNSSV